MKFSSTTTIHRSSKQDVFAKASNGRIKIAAKGVSRSHVFKKHMDYLHNLQTTKASYTAFTTITSHKYAVKTEEVSKLCLSEFDNKRYILPDLVTTLADGHFEIVKLNAETKQSIIIANLYIEQQCLRRQN